VSRQTTGCCHVKSVFMFQRADCMLARVPTCTTAPASSGLCTLATWALRAHMHNMHLSHARC
jgi:hypothetical protein